MRGGRHGGSLIPNCGAHRV